MRRGRAWRGRQRIPEGIQLPNESRFKLWGAQERSTGHPVKDKARLNTNIASEETL
jgi:hypothetical protein